MDIGLNAATGGMVLSMELSLKRAEAAANSFALTALKYVRFPLSLRIVEEIPRLRGKDVSQEPVRFRRMRSLQKLAAVHSASRNIFNVKRGHCSRRTCKLYRAAALTEWRKFCVARRMASLSWQIVARIRPTPRETPVSAGLSPQFARRS